MGRRTLLLIASILVAAVGTALIFLYVRGADDRAKGDAQLVMVVVARDTVPVGTSVSDAQNQNLFIRSERRVGDLPPGSFSNLSDMARLSDSKTTSVITAKSIINENDFAGPGAQAAAGVPDGKVAQSIQFPDPNRVAGIIKPGVQVAIMATYDDPDTKNPTYRYLMSGISVLAVGSQGATSGTAEAVAPQIIDLAVTFDQAGQLRLAEKIGELSLVVLSPGLSETPAPTATVDQLQYTSNESK